MRYLLTDKHLGEILGAFLMQKLQRQERTVEWKNGDRCAVLSRWLKSAARAESIAELGQICKRKVVRKAVFSFFIVGVKISNVTAN